MGFLPIINRNAVLISYKKPFINWVIQTDSEHKLDVRAHMKEEEYSVYLLPEFGDEREMWNILEEWYIDIFLNELESWCLDESLWPKVRTFDVFKEWFEVKVYTMIYDLVNGNIIKDVL